ncbi:MAG: glutamate--tRNA ligase [Candidatus Dormibacteraeota bacterium]|nr:glutamate--tRNA ligase [Candidatus Dormibacteraeota bacterium]
MAPSPTGYVHLGSARTMLFNYLFARQRGGSLLLRVDDTDVERNRADYEQTIYDGFHWLGLDWDEGPDVGGGHGPYRQSERLDLYREHGAGLLASERAYRCYCTREELDAERREAREKGVPYRYSRRCLSNPPHGREEFTVRLQVPSGQTSFTDLIRGELDFDNELIGDPVILRADGTPLYNFASTVDDALMGITHVIRGEEHLSNTPIQLMLFDALGFSRPEAFAHLPVIVGKDRAKLSKRKHPEVRLGLYQELGYLPEALVNYLALLGWNPGTEQEMFRLPELVQAFQMGRVQNASAMFDWDKLDWLNGQYIRGLTDEDLAERLLPFLPELAPETVRAAAPALKERLPRLDKARELLHYLTDRPSPPELDDGQRDMVQAALARLERTEEWTPEAIELALEAVGDERGWSRGKFFTPIRHAVAGRVSPPIHATLALLPREEALARLREAV